MVNMALGIDIGGSGMKAAPVNLETGEMTAKRLRISTPQPATPEAMAEVAAQLRSHFEWDQNIGCAFPGVVQSNVIRTAANVDPSWIGVDAGELLGQATGCHVRVHNDADAAGLAEVLHGAGRDRHGVILMLTLGTGIGSALFVDGVLMPNTEFGHLVIDGGEAEHLASARAHEDQELDWAEWAKRLTRFISELENLVWPDLIIVGGGVSRKWAKFGKLIDVRTPLVPAELRNNAGIIGAALAAQAGTTDRL